MQNRGFGSKPWVFTKSWVCDKIWWVMMKHIIYLLIFTWFFTWYKPIWRSLCLLARSLGWRFSVWCCEGRSILRYIIYMYNIIYIIYIYINWHICQSLSIYLGLLLLFTFTWIDLWIHQWDDQDDQDINAQHQYHSISMLMTKQKNGTTELYEYQSWTTVNIVLIFHSFQNIFWNIGYTHHTMHT